MKIKNIKKEDKLIEIIFEDDENLFNQYGIIKISKENCPNTKNKLASIFLKWIVSKDGQDTIASFSIENILCVIVILF